MSMTDDVLIIGNYTLGMACGLVNEIVRQKKKGLTHCSQSGHLIDEVLVAGGCVDRLVTAFVVNAGGTEGGSAVGRAWKHGKLQIEDYTNYNYNARLMAGMHGFRFMQVFEGIIHTDLFEKRGFMGENKYKVIKCPFTGEDTVLVPALNPDVCVIHVQRADKFGNAQYWGAMGSVQAAALASKRIIVSCEEIVEHDVVQGEPPFYDHPRFPGRCRSRNALGSASFGCPRLLQPGPDRLRDFHERREDGRRARRPGWTNGFTAAAITTTICRHYIERFGLESLNCDQSPSLLLGSRQLWVRLHVGVGRSRAGSGPSA